MAIEFKHGSAGRIANIAMLVGQAQEIARDRARQWEAQRAEDERTQREAVWNRQMDRREMFQQEQQFQRAGAAREQFDYEQAATEKKSMRLMDYTARLKRQAGVENLQARIQAFLEIDPEEFFSNPEMQQTFRVIQGQVGRAINNPMMAEKLLDVGFKIWGSGASGALNVRDQQKARGQATLQRQEAAVQEAERKEGVKAEQERRDKIQEGKEKSALALIKQLESQRTRSQSQYDKWRATEDKALPSDADTPEAKKKKTKAKEEAGKHINRIVGEQATLDQRLQDAYEAYSTILQQGQPEEEPEAAPAAEPAPAGDPTGTQRSPALSEQKDKVLASVVDPAAKEAVEKLWEKITDATFVKMWINAAPGMKFPKEDIETILMWLEGMGY